MTALRDRQRSRALAPGRNPPWRRLTPTLRLPQRRAVDPALVEGSAKPAWFGRACLPGGEWCHLLLIREHLGLIGRPSLVQHRFTRRRANKIRRRLLSDQH